MARQSDFARQQIDGTERQHPKHPPPGGEPVRDGVERAVATRRDDDVELRLGVAGEALGIAGLGAGAPRDDAAAAAAQRRNHPVEPAP